MDLQFIVNNWYLFAALIAILLIIGIDTARRGSGTGQISAVQLPQLLNQENAVVIDVCDITEFKKGHIPSAINIPIGELNEQKNKLEKYRKKERPIVLSCSNGQRANKAAAILRKSEFKNIFTLTGGTSAWQKENLPLER